MKTLDPSLEFPEKVVLQDHLLQIKPDNLVYETYKRLKMKLTKKRAKAMPRKIKLTLRLATLNKTKNNPPKIARINTKETMK